MTKIPVKYIRTDVVYDWKSPYGLVMSAKSGGEWNSVVIAGAEYMKLDRLEATVKRYLEIL